MNLGYLKHERAKAEAKRSSTSEHDFSDLGINQTEKVGPCHCRREITPQIERKEARTTLEEFTNGKPLEHYRLFASGMALLSAKVESLGGVPQNFVVVLRNGGYVYARWHVTEKQPIAHYYHMLTKAFPQ